MSIPPDVEAYHILTISTKAINKMLVSEEFLPWTLVSEEFPSLRLFLGTNISAVSSLNEQYLHK